MASMWEHATPLTSCPALENKTGAGKSGWVRQGRGRRRRHSPPGMGHRRDCPTLPAGKLGSNELASCAPLPLPQELGRPAGLGQQLIQEQGLGGENNASWGAFTATSTWWAQHPEALWGRHTTTHFTDGKIEASQAVTCPGPHSC